MFTLKIHHSGNFTSLLDRRYRYAVIEWIPRKSLDEGLDDEVNEASETGYRSQSILLNENDVQTRNMNSTSKHKGLVGDLKTWNDDDDLLQQVDPYDWQQDPYHGDDEAEENAELYAELNDLLEWFPFLNDELKENVVGVDAPVVAVKEQLERIEHVVDEEIERPRKRKRENEDESASANVLPFGKIKQEEKVESSLEGREGNERLWFGISCLRH
ncbi:hypothetical protein Tco_0762187 [Tanacetum coccineum]